MASGAVYQCSKTKISGREKRNLVSSREQRDCSLVLGESPNACRSHPLCLLGIVLGVLVFMPAGCGSTASVKNSNPTPPAVATALASSPLALTVGGSYQFSATVTNSTNTGVTWSVGGVPGGNSTVGTISASGLYSAPFMVPAPAAVSITATSQADTSKSAAATLTINILFTLQAPPITNLDVLGTDQLSVTVQGTANTAVTWAVNGAAAGIRPWARFRIMAYIRRHKYLPRHRL